MENKEYRSYGPICLLFFFLKKLFFKTRNTRKINRISLVPFFFFFYYEKNTNNTEFFFFVMRKTENINHFQRTLK